MKIAICISGIARPNSIRNVELVKQSFGGDVFCATWESTVNEHSAKFECDLYPEPKINYNPWTDKNCVCMHYKYHGYREHFLSGKYTANNKFVHATKQILGHAYQLQNLSAKYDLIVRTRWDTYVSPAVDFTKYINESYNENKAVGFAVRSGRHNDVHKFKEYEQIYVNETTPLHYSRDWAWWLNDNLIIHPRSLFDCNKAFKLNEESKLLPAEFGWYQMLSVDDNHKCVYGGAAIDRYV